MKRTMRTGWLACIGAMGLLMAAPAGADVVALVDLVVDTAVTDGGSISSTFSDAITGATLTVYTDSVEDAAPTNPSNSRYANYGATTSTANYVVIKFDLDALPGFAGSTINLAELRFRQGGGNSGSRTAGYVTTHDWVEGTGDGGYPGTTDPLTGGVSSAHPIGFNTGPNQDAGGGTTPPLSTWGPSSDSFFSISADTADQRGLTGDTGVGVRYIVWTVTDILALWAAGTDNYGFGLEDAGNYSYRLSEYATEADRPVLFIDYTPVPEPATMALLALGGLTMAGAGIRRRRRA